jgi:DNA-binding CsgD family transcriptional regulator
MAGEWDKALSTHTRARVRVPDVQRDWLQVPTLPVIAARDPQAVPPLAAHLTPLAEHEVWLSHLVLGPLADAQRWLGDGEAAAGTVRRIVELKVDGGDEWGLGQLLALAIGLGGLADAAAAAAVRQDDAGMGRLRAEGAAFIERARQVAERGQPRLATLGPEGLAWLARAEAEWARLEGRDDPEVWERSVAAFGFGQVYEVARSRRHLAEILAGRGDRGAAAEQARLARETAVSLQARPLRETIDALARRARLDLGGGPATSSVLTPREQEVMRLVAQGLTNRQIGRRLFISEKTASVHVSNVLGKLGAGGRTEAVAIAHRRGLLVDDPLDEPATR